jgi:O-antigen/teichoic acid export membrane protein
VLSRIGAWIPASLQHRSLRRNVLLNWTTAFLNAATALVTTPLLVRSLSTETYGVWVFLNGLTLYSNLLYFGLGAAFLKQLSDAVGRGDPATQSRLLGVALALYALIGATCFALAAALSPVVPGLLATPLPPETRSAASVTLLLLGVRLFVMFVNSAFSALLTAHGRWDLVSGIILVTTIVRTAGVFWAVGQPVPIISLAGVVVLDGVMQLPLLVLGCRAVAREVAVRPAWPTLVEVRSLFGFGAAAFVLQVAALVIAYTDTALIGILLGASAVTLYTLPLQLVEHSRIVVNGITQSLLPELAVLRVRGDTARLKSLYLDASRAAGAMSAFVNVHLVMLGPAFLQLWVGPEVATQSGLILLFLAVAATSSALSTQMLTPFYQALDRQPLLVAVVVVEALANFALSVWLARRLGVWGVALATALPSVLITLVAAPARMLPLLGVRLREFASHVAVPTLAIAAVCILAQRLLDGALGGSSYATLAVRVAAAALVALPVVATTFPRASWLPLVARVVPALGRRLQA